MNEETKEIMSRIGNLFLTWRRFLQRRIGTVDCTLKQHYLLNRLSREEYLIPSEIAKGLFCDRPTASVVIRNIEKKEWVFREKDPQNGKSFRIFITENGREVLSRTDKLLQTDINPTNTLTEGEKKELSRILKKMDDYLSSKISQ